jgi:hypothetical protein
MPDFCPSLEHTGSSGMLCCSLLQDSSTDGLHCTCCINH